MDSDFLKVGADMNHISQSTVGYMECTATYIWSSSMA